MSVETLPKAFAVMFEDILRWDVKSYASKIVSAFPLESLAQFIMEHNERVNLFEYSDKVFRILGVNNQTGIFHAYDTRGKNINQPYKKVSSRDFAYNPYRVNVGSIGLVPENLGGNYVSPAYVVFSVKKNELLPEYLNLILKAEWYNPILRAATAGSVRQNLTFDLLGTLTIPYPPVKTQKAIVNYWLKAKGHISQKYKEIEQVKDEEKSVFFQELGLKPNYFSGLPKCFGVKWENILRWGVNFNKMKQTAIDLEAGNYPVVTLGTLLTKMQYGTSQKANHNRNDVPLIRMNNIKDGTLDLSNLKYIHLPTCVKEKLLLSKGDILINRTNSKELVGKCAVFHENGEYVFASYIIRLKTNQDTYPDYISYVLNSQIGRQQINAISRQIIGQANINTKEIANFEVPLPPVKHQKSTMLKIKAKQQKVKEVKKEIEKIEANAKQAIEDMIVGGKDIEGVI